MTQKIHPLTGWKKENIPGMDKIRRFKKKYSKKEKNVWHDGQKLLKKKKQNHYCEKTNNCTLWQTLKIKQKTNKKMYYYPLLMNPDVLATTDTESRQ